MALSQNTYLPEVPPSKPTAWIASRTHWVRCLILQPWWNILLSLQQRVQQWKFM